MCPVCITTAMLIAGSVTGSGGLAAIATWKFGAKNAVDNHLDSSPSNLSEKEDRQQK